VAINIVAPEDHPNARRNFPTQMKILDYLWRHLGRPNVTLHAGELTLKFSPVEVMRNRIRQSIDLGHARRIGHGISIAWEDNLGTLLAQMKKQGILVEICLTSNDGILGVSGNRHPFMLYRRAGVPVCLNTDDEGVSRSNLTQEWVRCVRTYNLSYREMKEMARNAIEYSFLPGESLYRGHDYARLRPGFEGCRTFAWKPGKQAQNGLNASEKAQVQLKLEQAYAKFER
jgi:adenosine deaminase